MATITDLVMWKDTGYTDGATEIPPIGHTLRQPDLTIEGTLHPSKDRLFSELQIQVDYTTVLNMSYLRFTLDMDNGEDITIYGWIDDVKVQSDTSDHPLTIITWHVDPWRTFGARARYGSGHVLRRPSTSHDFYQSYPFRNKVLHTDMDENLLFTNSKTDGTGVDARWWVLIAYQQENDGGKVTAVHFITFPIGEPSSDHQYSFKSSNPDDNEGSAPFFSDVLYAKFDETIRINPKAITGAWLCPVPPFALDSVPGDGRTTPIKSGHLWNAYVKGTDPQTTDWYGWLETIDYAVRVFGDPIVFYHWEKSLSGTRVSQEGREYVITGPMGEIIGAVPFGKQLPSVIKFDLIASSTSANIRIELGPASEGMVFMYPLPAIDVNSNSWSDYVYSGQRDYDIQQRNLNSTNQMIEGAVTGAATGIMLGALAKPLMHVGGQYMGGKLIPHKTLNEDSLKAMGGYAALGSAGSLIGGALDLAAFNDSYQHVEDVAHAKQADTCLLAGSSYFLYAKTDASIRLQYLAYDTDSETVMNDIKAVQGVRYDAPVPDCTALINAGGPLQIRNLIVGGEIPAAVKRWIKEKFASGVRIIAR